MANLGGADSANEDMTELRERLAAVERRANGFEAVLLGLRGAIDAVVAPGEAVIHPQEG